MRILLVTHGLPPERVGGTEMYTADLARELGRQGHEVRVFLPARDMEADEFRWRRRSVEGLDRWEVIHAYRADNAFETHFRQPRLDPAMAACLEDFQPEVVHFTYWLGGLSTTLIPLAKERKARVVLTPTDFNPLCAWGQLLRSDGRLCEGPDGGLHCVSCFFGADPYVGVNRLKRFMVRRRWAWPPDRYLITPELRRIQARLEANFEVMEAADRVIFPTEALQERYEASEFHFERVSRLGYGIDLDLFRDFKRNPPASPFRLGFIGQLLPHKGLHILVEALEGLPNLQLVVYGDLEREKSRDYVENQCNGLRQSWIDFRGTFPPQQMAEVYASFDALAIPSIWPENSPLVLLYALVTGTPVLASDFGGLSPLIRAGETGLKVAPGDRIHWKRAVKFWMDRPDPGVSAEWIGEERQKHDIRSHVERLLAHYRGESGDRHDVGLD